METVGLVCLYGLTAFDDIRTKQVKVLEIMFFGVLGILFNLICKPYSLINVAGGVMVGGLLYLFSVLSKEKIGKGDSLIVMVSGLFLGFHNTLLLLWVSSLIAAIIGTVIVKKHGKEMDLELPFIPFLLIGYLVICMANTLGGLVVCG